MEEKTTDLSKVYQADVAENTGKRRHSDREDLRRIIQTVMNAPLAKGEVTEIEDGVDLKSYKGKNVRYKTGLILGVANEALKGDLKSAEFIMKYGGYEPPKEQNLTVSTPVLLDDVPMDGEGEAPTTPVAPEIMEIILENGEGVD